MGRFLWAWGVLRFPLTSGAGGLVNLLSTATAECSKHVRRADPEGARMQISIDYDRAPEEGPGIGAGHRGMGCADIRQGRPVSVAPPPERAGSPPRSDPQACEIPPSRPGGGSRWKGKGAATSQIPLPVRPAYWPVPATSEGASPVAGEPGPPVPALRCGGTKISEVLTLLREGGWRYPDRPSIQL